MREEGFDTSLASAARERQGRSGETNCPMRMPRRVRERERVRKGWKGIEKQAREGARLHAELAWARSRERIRETDEKKHSDEELERTRALGAVSFSFERTDFQERESKSLGAIRAEASIAADYGFYNANFRSATFWKAIFLIAGRLIYLASCFFFFFFRTWLIKKSSKCKSRLKWKDILS